MASCHSHRVTRGLKRTALLCAMALLSVNIWTGAPLLALWIGSRVQGDEGPSMLPFAVAGASMLALCLMMVAALSVLGARYDDLVGRKQPRAQAPWLRSLRGDRPHTIRPGETISALDKLLIVCVVLCTAAFEIWFFFFSGSPIGGNPSR